MNEIFALLISAVIGGAIGSILTAKFQNRSQLKENIFKPLYNEVDCILRIINYTNIICDKNFPHRPVWYALDSYARFRVPQKIYKLEEQFVANIEKWYELAFIQLRFININITALIDKLKDIFPKPLIFSANGEIYLLRDPNSPDKGRILLKNWLEIFGLIIFSSKERKGNDLFKALLVYSEVKERGFEVWLEEWHLKCNEVFDDIADMIHTVMPIELAKATAERDKQLEIVANVASELKRELEKEINKSW